MLRLARHIRARLNAQGASADHMDLRKRIMDYIEANRENFGPFIEDEEPFDTYCRRMREVTISRAAHVSAN